MRPLLVVFGSFGLAVGLLCAILAPAPAFGWFAYTPLRRSSAYESSLGLTLDPSPTLLLMPVAGLVLGLVLGVVLHRGRWRLRRD